jgi:hypothetical protein
MRQWRCRVVDSLGDDDPHSLLSWSSGVVVPMDEVSVADAAHELDISTERVRQRIGTGEIHARRVAGHWLVDPASLPSAPRRGRPMSPRIAWVAQSDLAPPCRVLAVLATLQHHCRVRSYLTSVRNHGLRAIDAMRDTLTATPWMPPTPA